MFTPFVNLAPSAFEAITPDEIANIKHNGRETI
jgi:hypothetical protein